MTTATDTTAAPGRTELQLAGADLLQELLAQLAHHGYLKAAIDTWRDPGTGHCLRHSYRNGEWTLTCWYDGRSATDRPAAIEHRYSVRDTMPDITTLVNAVIPPPF